MEHQMEEQEFLRNYDPSKYDRPSVTADIVVLTMDDTNTRLQVLLVKRGGHPYKDCWALPGGFVNAGRESADQAAARELEEETGITGAYLKQLYTFSEPDRDPRTHVISVAYTALIPRSALSFAHGDDAADARLFDVWTGADGEVGLATNDEQPDPVFLIGEKLAFDHGRIVRMALDRLRGRVSYEPDAFELLADKDRFTIHELKQVFQCILGRELDTPNFRKTFFRNYVGTGMAAPIGETVKRPGARPAALYGVSRI